MTKKAEGGNAGIARRIGDFFEEVFPEEELESLMDAVAEECVAEGRTNYKKLMEQWRAEGHARLADALDIAMKKALKRATN